MANYEFAVASEEFIVKPCYIEDVRRAIDFYEESYVDSKGRAFIGSYAETLTDELEVLIDKRTNKVVGTYHTAYQCEEDCIEWNCNRIEQDLKEAGIVDTKESYDIEDFISVPFFDFLMRRTEETSPIIIKEVGHEKLRYLCGSAVILYKGQTKWIELYSEALKFVEELDVLASKGKKE